MNIVDAQGSDPSIVQPTTTYAGDVPKMDMERTLPRQLSTGSTRGTQTIGYGSVKIDGSNNRISLDANNISITIGDTSDTDNNTGITLNDTTSNQSLVSLGRNVDSAGSTSGLIIYDSSNTRRLLGGQFPNGDIAIKLSQPTFDVATATDDQLIWSSDFNLFKIVRAGSTTVTIGSGDSYNTITTTIPHNLGYTPASLAYADIQTDIGLPASRVLTPYYQYEEYGTGVPVPPGRYDMIAQYAFSADSTNVYASILVQDVAFYSQLVGTYKFTYYLLQETAG